MASEILPYLEDPADNLPSEPVPLSHREMDAHLYNNWAKDPSKQNMSKLVTHLSPLLYKEVSRAGTSLPKSVLEAEAAIWAVKAVKSYDPSKGAALSTHLSNYLARVRRLNYQYQNAARLPENKQRQYNKYEMAQRQLEDVLNREPTDEELARELRWTKGQVVKFKSMLFKDYSESGSDTPTEYTSFSDEDLLLKELMTHLTTEEKFILDNKGKMPASQLAAKLGVDTNRLNYLQRKLVDKISYLKRELGL